MPVLCGDIGGTNTRLAILEPEVSFSQILVSETLPSARFATFEDAVADFLSRQSLKPKRAGFGIAGPIFARRCKATNLPWVIDAASLEQKFGFERVELLNDLEALAHGISVLDEADFAVLHEGEPTPGNAALIAAGTGLGQAGLYFDGSRHHPFASEGGHADLAPRNEAEIEVLQFLLRRHHRVSAERVVCGPGLRALYEFVLDKRKAAAAAAIEAAAQEGKAAAISKAGLEGSCEHAALALDLFVTFLAGEAGNLALKMMSHGGLYIGGGIAPKILPKLRHENFRRSFCDKGRMSPILEAMPMKVILNGDTALYGAALYRAARDGAKAPAPPLQPASGAPSASMAKDSSV